MNSNQLSIDSTPIRNFIKERTEISKKTSPYQELQDIYNVVYTLTKEFDYLVEFKTDDDCLMFSLKYA